MYDGESLTVLKRIGIIIFEMTQYSTIFILKILLTFLLSGHLEDVYIVPVSINYEKLMDGNYSTEQLVCIRNRSSFVNCSFM